MKDYLYVEWALVQMKDQSPEALCRQFSGQPASAYDMLRLLRRVEELEARLALWEGI